MTTPTSSSRPVTSSSERAAVPVLPPDLLLECHELRPARHLARLVLFAGLYIGSAALTVGLESSMETAAGWLLLIPLYVLSGAALHGISLFTHEAVHGTLWPGPRMNGLLGAVCAWPVLQNYSAYRVLHLRHHRHLGQEGDPDHYENYTRWSWMVFTMNWLRLVIGYPVYIAAIPILGFRQGTARDRIAIVAEVVALLAIAAAACWAPVPRSWLLHAWFFPMLVINTLVNIRGMSQHTLLEHATDEVRGTRSILTGPLVRFFMCNENFHLEHHLYPGIPWHRLPLVHKILKPELTRRGAPYIPSYSAFVVEFLHGSLRRSPWGRRNRSTRAEENVRERTAMTDS